MADTTGFTANSGSFKPPPNSGMSPSDFYNALVTDPFYAMTKAYLDSSGTLASSTLDTETANAQRDNALANARIQFNLADTQRGITQNLADRQATESGDNAFYHGQANTLAGFDTQAAANQLQDYLAGVQAAYAQGVLDRQNSQNQALYGAYQNETNYYNSLPPPGGNSNPPPTAPPPSPTGTPDLSSTGIFQSGGQQYVVPH